MKGSIQGFGIEFGTFAKFFLALALTVNAGCGGGGGGGSPGSGNPTPDNQAPNKVFVAESVNSVILSSPNADPFPVTLAKTITGPATSSLMPDLAYDSVNDRLYVAKNSSITVIEHASVADGPTNPARTITINATLHAICAISLDTANDVLYVADCTFASPKILVFSNISTANGLTAPSRSILLTRNGAAVGPSDVYIDPVHNVLYVPGLMVGAFSRVILIYTNANTVDGAATADRELTFADNIVGIIGDSARDRLFVENASTGTVMVFDAASTANGTGTPNRTINFPSVVHKIALGGNGNRLYGLSTAPASAGVYIVEKAGTSNGTVPVSFSATPGGFFPTAIAVGP